MSVLVSRDSKVILQGLNTTLGKSLLVSIDRKSVNLVGGVLPGEGGGWCAGGKTPLFDSVLSAVKAVNPNVYIVTTQPAKAYQAIIEGIQFEIPLIICMTRNIPIHDMVKIKALLSHSETNLLGPNSFGIHSPGEITLGSFFPLDLGKGKIGIISQCAALTYEFAFRICENGKGISTAVGIGNSFLPGLDFHDVLPIFDKDPDSEKIIICGQFVGNQEITSISSIARSLSKPVLGLFPTKGESTYQSKKYVDENDEIGFQDTQKNVGKIIDAGIPTFDNVDSLIEKL